jgi:hypothetical protein
MMWQRAPHTRALPHSLSSPLPLFPYSVAGCLLSSSPSSGCSPRLLLSLRRTCFPQIEPVMALPLHGANPKLGHRQRGYGGVASGPRSPEPERGFVFGATAGDGRGLEHM